MCHEPSGAAVLADASGLTSVCAIHHQVQKGEISCRIGRWLGWYACSRCFSVARAAANVWVPGSLTSSLSQASELVFRSSGLPGGSFVAAVNDRQFMQLSDRGGASNQIGDRWADLCAVAIDEQPALRLARSERLAARLSMRLDDIPAIARLASRAQLQNPDFLLIAPGTNGPVVWASDAKFSVDTARSKQVSIDMLTALLGQGGELANLLQGVPDDARYLDGTFLCPDYPLTHLLLRDRRGPRRATVRNEEVRFVQVDPLAFLEPLGLANLRSYLATLDGFPFDPDNVLLVGLYYYRLARAAVGCWLDQASPLLTFHDDQLAVDESALLDQARSLAAGGQMSAWGLLMRWNDLAEQTRQQRVALDRASAPPINGRKLREIIEHEAERRQVVPPSGSKVRRLVGAWFRFQVREQFGPIMPPVHDFDAVLADVARFSRSLGAATEVRTREVLDELFLQALPLAEEETVEQGS